MGVYIKDMEMPETCEDCQFHRYHSHHEYVCVATPLFYPMNLANSEGIRKEWCPLVSVPEPHGDLIDRQKLLEDNKHLKYPTNEKYRRDRAWAVGFNAGARHCNEHAVYAKTVIKAEGE